MIAMIENAQNAITCFVVGLLIFTESVGNAQESGDAIKIHEIKVAFSRDPKLEQFEKLADYLRSRQATMSREDKDVGTGLLVYMTSSLDDVDLNVKLNLLTGIRSARIARLGIGYQDKAGAVGAAAKNIISSSPGGVVDYFVDAIDGKKSNVGVLLGLGNDGVKILTDDLSTEPDPKWERRIFGTLAGMVSRVQPSLDDKTLESAISALIDSVKNMDESGARMVLAHLYKISHPRIIQMAEDMAKTETDPQLREAAELLAKSFRKNSEALNKDAPRTVPKSQPAHPTSEPTFAKKPPVLDKKPAEPEAGDAEADSNPFPYWIFVIGGVVVIGLLVVLKRK